MDLTTYISDNLISLAGASEPTIISFVHASAKRCKSSGQLFDELSSVLDGKEADIKKFTDGLYARVGVSSNGTRAKENGGAIAKDGRKEQKKKYALVDMGEPMEEDWRASRPVVQEERRPRDRDTRRERSREREHRKRDRDRSDERDDRRARRSKKVKKRDANDDQWADIEVEEEEEAEEEETRGFSEPAAKRAKLDDGSPERPETREEDELDPEEREKRNKEEFEARLKEKDKAKSKKPSGGRGTRELPQDTTDLRQQSRQQYLAKRNLERLALLRQQVMDEAEELRNNPDLSQAEQEQFARNREILRLAEQREAIDDHVDGYAMPEDYLTEKGKIDRSKKSQALNQRLTDRDEYGRERFVTEHEEWEREQVAKAKAQVKRGERMDEGDYEYVWDPQMDIKFVMDHVHNKEPKMTAEQAALKSQLDAAESKANSIEESRKNLPVAKYRGDLIKALEEYQCMVIVGETGSGKSTQIPRFLHDAGYSKKGKIACTQPRRIAAMSLATRVAEEFGCKVGNEIGYSIRFEENTNEKTIIKYLTDGKLLRDFLTDPTLSDYSALMIDEAHERTLSTDILFGLIKDVAKLRPDLKILISSATLDAEKFSKYFDDCPIFNIPGRTHPVEVFYTGQPEANYLAAAITTTFQIHLSQPAGDILVFLTGEEEIQNMADSLTETARKLGSKAPELIVRPVYASLPSEEQAKIFEPTPPKARKVVLATNIAETSLTIDGIVYVIDPGFVKQNEYNARTGMSSLVVTPCSRASANQRAGRAGRNRPGKCFRLMTRHSFYNDMPESTPPEILRTNLNSVTLLLKSLGINDLLHFDFLDPPAPDAIVKSLELLYCLGSISANGAITKTGRQMAEFPTDPMLSKAVIGAGTLGCALDIISIVAMLGESSALFYRPREQKVHADSARARFTIKEGGDHATLLNIWNQFEESDYSMVWCRENFLQYRSLSRARSVREQIQNLAERTEVPLESVGLADCARLLKALTTGFFPNAARLSRNGMEYRTIRGAGAALTAKVHPSSVLREEPPRIVIYHEVVLTSAEFMRNVFPVNDAKWLQEAAPYYWQAKDLEGLGSDKKGRPRGEGKASSMKK